MCVSLFISMCVFIRLFVRVYQYLVCVYQNVCPCCFRNNDQAPWLCAVREFEHTLYWRNELTTASEVDKTDLINATKHKETIIVHSGFRQKLSSLGARR